MTGIERLNSMIQGQNDTALIRVVDYLKTRKDLDNKFLNEEKDLKQMCNFIQDKAKKNCISKTWNCISGEVVYAWAILYFLMPNSALEIKPAEKKKATKKAEKPNNIIQMPSPTPVDSKKEENQVEQISLFGLEDAK